MRAGANRWFLYGPLIGAAIVLGCWFLLWRAGAATMRASLDEFAAAQAENGLAVAYEPLRTRGFPFFLRGAAENFSISRGEERYQCARLYIDALPYAPDRIIFSCGAEQRLITPDGAWTLEAKDARASVERDKDRGWLAKIESGKASAFHNDIEVSADRAIINVAPGAPGDGRIDASVRIVSFGVTRPASGYAFDRIDVAATVSGGGAAGGRIVEIHGFEAVISETVVTAKGEISLAAGGNARGRLDARIEKPAGLAHTLADAGLLDERDAKSAEAGLAMLAVASGGAISAPIEFDGGEVRLAGVKLADLKRKNQP